MVKQSKRKQTNVKQPRALVVEPKRPPNRICLACRERSKILLAQLIAKELPVKDTKVNGKGNKINK